MGPGLNANNAAAMKAYASQLAVGKHAGGAAISTNGSSQLIPLQFII
jgi:hypothetical protein